MILCVDQRNGTGCSTENRNGALHCKTCGKPLRFAVQLRDSGDLVGPYKITRMIGHGGFGAVYEAETSEPPISRVAIKESFDPESIVGFRQEFAVLSNLDHPNLPQYLDVFEADDNGYLVMEFVPGQSLQEVLDRQQTALIESQVLGYALQLCDALAYLHQQQPPILHRDVKPANIRLTPEGLIKLVDFGLLKQGSSQTRRTIRGVGTPAYAPVEQYGRAEQHTDARSDIYSLGATLYHLLGGHEPLAATDRIIAERDPLPPLRQHAPRLSSNVADAVMRAISITQHHRFTDTNEFKAALLGITVAAAQPASPSQPATRATAPQPAITTPETPPAAPIGVPRHDEQAHLPRQPALMEQVDYLAGHTDHVTGLAWSSSSTSLISCSLDGTVRSWHPGSNKGSEVVADYKSPLWHIIRIPDTAHVAVGGAHRRIDVLDEATGAVHYSMGPHQGTILQLALQPSGHVIASAGIDLSVRLWDLRTHNLIHQLHGHLRSVSDVAWHPTKSIVASTSEDGTLRIWSAADGGAVHTTKAEEWFSCVCYTPNGNMLATGGKDGHVRIWRTDTMSVTSTLKQHKEGVKEVLFSPDNRWLISVADDAVLVWDVAACRLLGTFPSASTVEFSPDGRLLALGRAGPIEIWRVV